MIKFTVFGAPIAQPRVKAQAIMSKTGRMFAHVYEPGKKDSPARQWKADVKVAALQALNGVSGENGIPWKGPVALAVDFYLPRPASRSRKKDVDGPLHHDVKPDTDNLFRAIADSLTGVIFHDDKQICDVVVRKFFHEKSGGPRAEISVAAIE